MKYPFFAASIITAVFAASASPASAYTPQKELESELVGKMTKKTTLASAIEYVCKKPGIVANIKSVAVHSPDKYTAYSFIYRISPDNPKLFIPLTRIVEHNCPKFHEPLAR